MVTSINHVLSEIRGLLPDRTAVRDFIWSIGGPLDPVVEDYLRDHEIDLGERVLEHHDNGKMRVFGFRDECVDTGLWRRWHPNGQLAELSKMEGKIRVVRTWDPDGRPIEVECWDLAGRSIELDAQEEPATLSEEEAAALRWIAHHKMDWGSADTWFLARRLSRQDADWWDKARHKPLPPLAIQWFMEHGEPRYFHHSALVKAIVWSLDLSPATQPFFEVEPVELAQEFDDLEALCEAIDQGTLSIEAEHPTFGGEPFTGRADVLSWDEERLLVGREAGELAIIDRGEYSLMQAQLWEFDVLDAASEEDWMVF